MYSGGVIGTDFGQEKPLIDKRLRSELILVGLTLLWGTSFLVVQNAEASISAGSLTFLRFSVAASLLLPFLRMGTKLWLVGIEMGALLWGGFITQAIGLHYTTSGRSAFVTSLAVIFVPIFAAIVGRRIGIVVWIAAAVALGGAAMLCYDNTPANKGDLWTLLCAALFAIFIVQLETASHKYPTLPLTAIQLLTVAVCSMPWFVHDLSHGLRMTQIPWKAVMYLGVACTALTTWLQNVGQRDVPAAQASIIFLLEPVFATIFAFVFVHDRMGWRGITGCVLIIGATVFSQIPLIRVREPVARDKSVFASSPSEPR